MLQRLLALLLLAFGLSACGSGLDADQIRTCRQALPAVDPDARSITVTGVSPAADPYTLRIDYRALSQGIDGSHHVLCHFGPSRQDARVIVLDRLATENEVFSPLKLHILKRYWLDRHEDSYAADPGPGETAVAVPEVPLAVAYLAQSAANGLPGVAMTMLIAVAYALIFGLVGRINLAFGDFAAFGGLAGVSASLALLALGSRTLALNLTLSAIASVSLAVLAGHVVSRLVFAPLVQRRGQTILIATVGVALIMREGMRLIEGPQNRWTPPLPASPIPLLRAGDFIVDITPLQAGFGAGAAILSLAVVWLMHHSRFGRQWRAMSDDALMASLTGVSNAGMLSLTFALASALAGLAGFIMAATYGSSDTYAGVMIGLRGLIAAVIGGIGSVGGALVGGLALGVFEMVWQAYMPIGNRDVAVLVVLVTMLVFRPGGLFGLSQPAPREI